MAKESHLPSPDVTRPRSPAGGSRVVANPTLAIGLMCLAGALVAVTSILAKALGSGADGLHPLQVSAGRFGFAFLTLLAVMAVRPELRPNFKGTHWPTHFARVLCGWGGISTMFAAVAEMPVAEATALSFLSPPITMLLAVLFLGESLSLRKVLAAILAVLGAGLLLNPTGAAIQPAALYALASAGFLAVEVILIKRLSDTEPPMRILFLSNSLGSLVALSAASFVWQDPLPGQWLMLAALGSVMVTGQSVFIQSMKRAEASLVAPAFYSVLVFAALYDFVLFGVAPSLLAVCGAALIIAGGLLLARARG